MSRRGGEVGRVAAVCGVHVATNRPGDGVTRYRFFEKPAEFSSGEGLFTANGRKEAIAFARGVCARKCGPAEPPKTGE